MPDKRQCLCASGFRRRPFRFGPSRNLLSSISKTLRLLLESKENPFFARATVNRLWFYLLGRGIVDPEDGTARRTTHEPELSGRDKRNVLLGQNGERRDALVGQATGHRTSGAKRGNINRPAIPPESWVMAFLVGVGVTLAAALEPARRAGRIQPVEALKARLDLPSARRARLRWLAGVFVVVSLVGLLVAPRGTGIVQPLVVYAILLVGTLLIPIALPTVARVAGIPFALVLRFEERLA